MVAGRAVVVVGLVVVVVFAVVAVVTEVAVPATVDAAVPSVAGEVETAPTLVPGLVGAAVVDSEMATVAELVVCAGGAVEITVVGVCASSPPQATGRSATASTRRTSPRPAR